MRSIVAAVIALAFAGDDPKPQARSVACELISTKHIAVSVRINDQGPYRMIFDTGSPVVLVNTRVAREAKIAESTRGVPKARSLFPGQMVAKSIEIGTAKADNVPVAVLDHPTLKAIEGMVGRVDGIVGFPFFSRFKTTIDYPQSRLTFEPNGYTPDDAILSIMNAMLERSRKGAAKTIVPSAQWGMEVEKPDDAPGLRIKAAFANGPAAAAGVRNGDRLLKIDGRWTDTAEDCFHIASELPPGQAVIALIRRANADLSVKITPKSGF